MISPKSYARAYVAVTESLDALDRIAWLMVVGSTSARRSITRVLQGPDPITTLTKLGLPEPTARFLVVVADDRALQHLPTIAKLGLRLLADASVGTPAELVTAKPLTNQQQQNLAAAIAAVRPQPIVLESRHNSSLLGGFTLDLATQRLDQSLGGRLAELRRTVQTA